MTCFNLSMFTLAHLSDPHLAPLPTPRWGELIGKRVTGYINWLRRRRFIHDRGTLDALTADLKAQGTDHIAVTGDIVNIAAKGEFPPGRAFLESLGPAHEVSFVPGNHDIYVRAGARYAARAFGAYMSGDDDGFPPVRRRGLLALICVSTGVPTAWGMATGRIGPAQLGGLAARLIALKREKLMRVILIHHPPVSEAGWHKRLVDREVLKQVVAEHGAELMLHGHDHRAMLNWLEGPGGTRVPAAGVPSASAKPGVAKQAAAYNLYAIDGARGAWTCEMISRGVTAEGKVVERKRMMLVG
jgi:3',5'-cyclic AMP phosphodiesterase CpdA